MAGLVKSLRLRSLTSEIRPEIGIAPILVPPKNYTRRLNEDDTNYRVYFGDEQYTKFRDFVFVSKQIYDVTQER